MLYGGSCHVGKLEELGKARYKNRRGGGSRGANVYPYAGNGAKLALDVALETHNHPILVAGGLGPGFGV